MDLTQKDVHYHGNLAQNNAIQLFGNTGPISIIQRASQTGDDGTDLSWFKYPRAIEAELFTSKDEAKTSRCLSGTRIRLLETIQAWAVRPDAPCVFWLSGLAGSGKSTVARTAAYEFNEKKLLGATFFFSRDQTETNNTRSMALTMAFQLARGFPHLRCYIREVIDNDPKITSMSLAHQLRELIIMPLEKAKTDSGSNLPVVFVIDALDECNDKEGAELILALLDTAEKLQRAQARVLITCRQKSHIDESFRRIPQDSKYHVVLHEVDRKEVDMDIRIFLESELQQKLRLSVTPANMEKLLQLSAGLFIFAATVCRYVSRIRQLAHQRLAQILNNLNSGYLSPLDQLYLQALGEAVLYDLKNEEMKEVCRLIRRMAGTVVTLATPLSIEAMAGLLNESVDQTRLVLGSLRAVFDVPDDDKRTTRALHESFHDFLLNRDRCTDIRFYVQEEEMHSILGEQCLALMNTKLKQDILDIQKPGTMASSLHKKTNSTIPKELQYACKHWVYHLHSSKALLKDGSPVHQFLEIHFLNWIEVLSLLGNISDGILMITTLFELVTFTTSPGLYELVNDARRFLLSHGAVIGQAPLQLYYSTLIFSPSNSQVRKLFERNNFRWIWPKPQVENDWSALLQTIEGHSSSVYSVAFSPDGRYFVSGSHDKSVRIWNAVTGKLKQTLEGHSGSVYSVAISPDGGSIVSGSLDKTLRIWSAVTGELKEVLKGHSGSVRALSFSPDGAFIASGGGTGDGTVRIWDVDKTEPRSRFKGNLKAVYSIAFSPDGRWIISGSDDSVLRIWNTTTGEQHQEIESGYGPVRSVAFSPDGLSVICGSGSANTTVKTWDIKTGKPKHTLLGHSDSVWATAYSLDGRRIATGGGSEDRTIRIWNAETGDLLGEYKGHSSAIWSIAFSPDGDRIVSGSFDQTVRIWDTTKGRLQQTLENHSNMVRSVQFSPSGDFIVSGSENGYLQIWDAKTSKIRKSFRAHWGPVLSIEFSPFGETFLTLTTSNIVAIWNAATGSLQLTFKKHRSIRVLSAMFSPDGLAILSRGFRECFIWNVVGGSLRFELDPGFADEFRSARFSPTGDTILTGSNTTVRIWNAATGRLQQTFEGHPKSVEAVGHSPLGNKILSGSEKTIRIWDSSTGKLKGTLNGHNANIALVEFSKDGRHIVSGAMDDTICIWDAVAHKMEQKFKGNSNLVKPIASSLDGKSPNIYAVGRWIKKDHENLLLLPENCQVLSMAVCGKVLAIGSPSGIVTILGFNFGEARQDDIT